MVLAVKFGQLKRNNVRNAYSPIDCCIVCKIEGVINIIKKKLKNKDLSFFLGYYIISNTESQNYKGRLSSAYWIFKWLSSRSQNPSEHMFSLIV